jgi:Skp family chaperone for outer membrane proteins
MGSIERKTKQVFRSIQASFGTLMRARLVSERQARAKKIKTIRATIRAIDAALEKPGSEPALRRLRAVKNQMAELLDQEVSDLTKRVDNSRRMLARLRSPRSFPFLKP